MKILISAGEASGDRYAAGVARALGGMLPGTEFFGCTGLEMRAAGVRTVVDAASLSVLGLAEVVAHLPRIYREYRKLIEAARRERPRAAVLTDSAGFHLRVAARLKEMGVPVFQLVAPQAWAWREGRVRQLRRNVAELHCIFPFEEEFFRARGVEAHYIGHPLARIIRPRAGREEFLARHRLAPDRPLITLCPGSRPGEIARHLPALSGAVERILAHRSCTFLLAAPAGSRARLGEGFFSPLCGSGRVRYCEGETWDAMAHADLTLAASGTVTTEAALLGAPVVAFYRVSGLTYWAGRPLVRAQYFTIVNLVAGRAVIPELIQRDMTAAQLAGAALRLLADDAGRERMRAGLAQVRAALQTADDPFAVSARRIVNYLREERT